MNREDKQFVERVAKWRKGDDVGLSENRELLNAVHSGKVLTTSNGNESGTLWECLWRWTEEAGYQSKSCSSGLFLDWHTYDSQTHFLNRLKEDIADFRFSGI